MLRRLKKRRLALRDQIARLETRARSARTRLMHACRTRPVRECLRAGRRAVAAPPTQFRRARGPDRDGAGGGAHHRARRRAGGRGRHRRRQDLLLPGAGAAERRTRAAVDRHQDPAGPAVRPRPAAPGRGARPAGAHRAAQGPRQLPVPASARTGAPGRARCPIAARCARWPRSSSGRRPRAPATWPNCRGWTSARR